MMNRVELLTSNEAAARAVRFSKPQVIPTYPITPQSPMLGSIAKDVETGLLKAEFLNMESDYAAMAAAVGASLGGTRVFTATNSQGILLMAEHLYTASGSRCPIVMAVVNRAISVPHSRYADHNDALAVNRAGWIQLYCEDAQEVLETAIQLFRISEDSRVRLPGMFCYESFIHSNTAEGVVVPEAKAVDRFLGRPRVEALLDPSEPRSLNPPTPPEWYTEFKYAEQQAMEAALYVIPESGAAYAEAVGGRPRGLLETTEPAGRYVLACMGSIAKTARRAVRELQAEGVSASLLKIRAYRPFPEEPIREALRGAEGVIAIDRNFATGSHGVLYEELRSALYGVPTAPRIVGVIAGLGGRDVTVGQLKQVTRLAAKREAPFDKEEGGIHWLGLDRGRVRDESPQTRPVARAG